MSIYINFRIPGEEHTASNYFNLGFLLCEFEEKEKGKKFLEKVYNIWKKFMKKLRCII